VYGGTYASLKKGVKNKNITLERELCLIYDYIKNKGNQLKRRKFINLVRYILL
jgi:hypothetical protein